jgi:DNA-binding IclR family transcriptional regulator
VKGAPSGITIPELATKMGIKQNYLYRVLPGLQKEGKVRKRGRSWYPRAA